ncbi:MAG: hypothetical protein SGCHY_003692 [Lobulomycetales sp.]
MNWNARRRELEAQKALASKPPSKEASYEWMSEVSSWLTGSSVSKNTSSQGYVPPDFVGERRGTQVNPFLDAIGSYKVSGAASPGGPEAAAETVQPRKTSVAGRRANRKASITQPQAIKNRLKTMSIVGDGESLRVVSAEEDKRRANYLREIQRVQNEIQKAGERNRIMKETIRGLQEKAEKLRQDPSSEFF